MNLLSLLPASLAKNKLAWSLASALLLCLGWWVHPLFLLVAFTPLLVLESMIPRRPGSRRGGWQWLGYSYLTLFLWNLGTTWWIWNSTAVGAILAIVLNAVLMCLPLAAYRLTSRGGQRPWAPLTLGLWWVLFEFIHLNWDLSWSWLNLGNAFALTPSLIQWYEITGTLGGTLWVTATSYLAFVALTCSPVVHTRRALVWLAATLIPILISLVWPKPGNSTGTAEVVMVQPNVDPYEKFDGDADQQVATLLRLSDSTTTPKTQWVLWPETALPHLLSEDTWQGEGNLTMLQRWVDAHPNAALLTGASTWHTYAEGTPLPPTARKRDGMIYDVYNTGMCLRAKQPPLFYHKSKLVPGVEQLPYPAVFNWLGESVFNLGGTTGALGTQPTRIAFTHPAGTSRVAPVICYESVYGSFATGYAQAGADFLGVITNDGWWGNTPGHRQHLAYASLRAIELRRDVARSANTGISAVIRADGSIEQTLGYEKQGAIRAEINLYQHQTVYARFGDWVVAVAALLLVGVLAFYGVAQRRA